MDDEDLNREPIPPSDDPEVPDGVLNILQVMFVEAIGEVTGWEPVEDVGDPHIDQLQAMLKESFVFRFTGVVAERDGNVNVDIAMPAEAVMFIITTVMRRMQEQGLVQMIDPNNLPPGFPPGAIPNIPPNTSPGGLFLP